MSTLDTAELQACRSSLPTAAEDVSVFQDAHRVIVAVMVRLISAKRFTAGIGAMQWLGQMSDAPLLLPYDSWHFGFLGLLELDAMYNL
jgi:hypothetical protein